jgi:4-hydroxy-tetrahydrodipicolinate reductase
VRQTRGVTTRVGVVGASGRMGSQACRAIEEAPDLELVAAVGRGDPLERLVEAGAQVAVELTRPDAVMGNLRWCVEHGLHAVVGTSGLTPERLDEVRRWLEPSPAVGIVVVPNFSLGAVLMMRFAEQAARFYESVEIVELHHAGKVDAPSGTALRTAERVAAARARAGSGPAPDATTDDPHGARGASIDGVHVHAVRLPGLVAHQEVLLGSVGELLTLRHDSLDRTSFMPGLLLAVREVLARSGLTVGLEHLLDLG